MRRIVTPSRAALLSAGLIVFLVLAPVPVQGLDEAVDFRYKLAPGEILTYSYTFSQVSRFRVMSIMRSNERQVTGQHIMNVKSVSDDGSITLEIVSRLHITEQGRSEDPPALPKEIQLRPNGEILKPEAARKSAYLLAWLPGHLMANNDSWTYGEFVGVVGFVGFVAVPRTLTLIGVERTGEQHVARIQIHGESPVSYDFTLPTGAEEARMHLEGTVKLTGEILWQVDQGRMQRFREEASLEVPVQVHIAGASPPGWLSFKSIEQVDTVPGKN